MLLSHVETGVQSPPSVGGPPLLVPKRCFSASGIARAYLELFSPFQTT